MSLRYLVSSFLLTAGLFAIGCSADTTGNDPDSNAQTEDELKGGAKACENKACGDECSIDPCGGNPACKAPSYLGYCNPQGQCTIRFPICQ